MRAEYINPFIKASKEVLTQMTGIDFNIGKPFIKTSPYDAANVIIIIGITGDIKGQALISIDLDIALTIVSNMMVGMEVTELNEMSKSALSELGNMIMGNSATLLFNSNIKIDITPPTLMIGQGLSISTDKMNSICIPIETENKRVELNILVKE